MTHNRLNDCRVCLFIHQETREAVPSQIVKPEAAQPVPFFAEQFILLFDQNARPYRSGPDVIPDQLVALRVLKGLSSY